MKAHQIEEALHAEFDCEKLRVRDMSHLHQHHAHSDKKHYEIQIVSKAFNKMTQIQIHQIIYKTLNFSESNIHSLKIKATGTDL